MELDWDLLAVVRGCTFSSSSSTAATLAGNSPPADLPTPPPAASNYARFSSGSEDLQDLYKPFFPNPESPISTTPFAGGLISKQHQIMFQQQSPQQVEESQLIYGGRSNNFTPRASKATISQTGHQKAKKRKILQKKVCQVPAEGVASDMWAWRKYGQKPIKGSPYPRGYYKCSSSKGCPARKQVERNRSNPKMITVTYTSEHNHSIPTHRNSLAGSTRQKPATTASASTEIDHPAESPSTEKAAEVREEHEEEKMAEIDDTVLSDDFFAGIEELDGTVSEFFCDRVEEGLEVDFPWFSGFGSAAAAAGGS